MCHITRGITVDSIVIVLEKEFAITLNQLCLEQICILMCSFVFCMYQELSMTWPLGEIWRFTWYSNYMCNTMS